MDKLFEIIRDIEEQEMEEWEDWVSLPDDMIYAIDEDVPMEELI